MWTEGGYIEWLKCAPTLDTNTVCVCVCVWWVTAANPSVWMWEFCGKDAYKSVGWYAPGPGLVCGRQDTVSQPQPHDFRRSLGPLQRRDASTVSHDLPCCLYSPSHSLIGQDEKQALREWSCRLVRFSLLSIYDFVYVETGAYTL